MMSRTGIIFSALLLIYLIPANSLEIPQPRKHHIVRGASEVNLAVQEWGNPAGTPIIFIHAWSQSHLGWLPQVSSTILSKYRIITYDLRGHGNSDKPLAFYQYKSSDLWADDLRSIVSFLHISKPVLVGWSYGSVVAADYIEKYGSESILALNVVAGTSSLGTERSAKYFGPASLDSQKATIDKLPTQALGMVDVANMMLPESIDREMYGFIIATNMMTPPFVRKAMSSRHVDYMDLYKSLTIPVLFTHGANDKGILPIASQEGASFVSNSKVSIYEGANHGPHWADPDRYNRELSALIQSAL